MRASGISAQPPVSPAQAADGPHAVPLPVHPEAVDAAPTQPPSAQGASVAAAINEMARTKYNNVPRKKLKEFDARDCRTQWVLETEEGLVARGDLPPLVPVAPEAKTHVQQPAPPARDAGSQPEPAPKLLSPSEAKQSEPPLAHSAAGSAAPGPSAAVKKELMDRFNKGAASDAELKKYYQDVLQGRGISGIVAEISSWEETSVVNAEAVKVVSHKVCATKRKDYAQILTECSDAGLVPMVVEANSRYRHCHSFPQCAFVLLGHICERAKMVLEDDAAMGSTVAALRIESAAAADICLCFISTQQSSITGASCESAFLFLALLFGESQSCEAHFRDYALQHGDRVIRLCMTGLRKCRGTSMVSEAMVETLMQLALSSNELASYAATLNAVDLLIKMAPLADMLLSNSSRTTLGYIARALCAIVQAVVAQMPLDAKTDLGWLQSVLGVLMVALRHEILNDPSPLLETLELLFRHMPALVSTAVKAGALDLEDANDESSVIGKFVDRLKALVDNAEASAAAAAADLLAAEDAEQACAAAKAAKPKRAKKPAPHAASTSAVPSPDESHAAGGQQPPTDPSVLSAGQALELSQSESALRRRRRAATKAVRRAAAAARVQRGGKEKAAEDSSDSDERAAACDDASPPPASGADEAQPVRAEPGSGSLDEPAAVAAQPTEVPLADLFPWMAISDAAASPAAQRFAPRAAAPLRPEPAPPALTPPHLPSPLSLPHVPLERFEALCAELACAKNELARAIDELARDKDELDASKCVICLSVPRCLAVLPCRHLPLCAAADCAAAMGAPPRCPLCRVGVVGTMQLFV